MVLSGSVVDRSLIAVLGVAVLLLAFVLLRRSVKTTVVVWLGFVCFVPVWIGVGLGFSGNLYLPLASLVAVVAIAVFVPAHRYRPGVIDGLMLLLVLATIAALFTGNRGIALVFVFSLFTYFVVGYVLGRLAPARVSVEWIYGAIAVIFTIVAALAIVESITGVNIFVGWKANNSLYSLWGVIQERGGMKRVEGAFGHSIALGASLALAIPITLASRFRSGIRVAMVLLMLVAAALTFSRIGIICSLLSVVLSVAFLRDGMPTRMRVAIVSLGTAATLALLPLVGLVFSDAGEEAVGSAAYRGNLLSLVSEMNVIGVADTARRAADGEVYFGNFQSIDSQLILTGLSGGLLVLGSVLIALAAAIVLMVTRRGSAATIAIVAQIPAFATAALITQYAIFVWFVAGLAVTTQLAHRKRGDIPAVRRVQGPRPLGAASGSSLRTADPGEAASATPIADTSNWRTP